MDRLCSGGDQYRPTICFPCWPVVGPCTDNTYENKLRYRTLSAVPKRAYRIIMENLSFGTNYIKKRNQDMDCCGTIVHV
jgi:hypothetical protein